MHRRYGSHAAAGLLDRADRSAKRTGETEPFDPEQILRQVPPAKQRTADYLWRFIDIIAAANALLIFFPLLVLIAIVVRIDSRGPVLFRQWRVGRGGRLFRFVKFRTMVPDADAKSHHRTRRRLTAEELDQLRFKKFRDPRITRVGWFLRRTSLDELPSFWNVLTGDMSLIGPRPEVVEMLQYYRPEQLVKFSVRPGVTGLAQVTGRSDLTFLQTVARDIELIQQRGWLRDLSILARTFTVVLTRKGAF